MVEVVIVVMLIPITICVPAVRIFVPPAVLVFPAIGACFGKFVAPVFRLAALPAVVLNGFMELVVRLDDAFLAVIVCTNKRRSNEKKGGGKRRGSKRATNPLCFWSHVFSKSEIT